MSSDCLQSVLSALSLDGVNQLLEDWQEEKLSLIPLHVEYDILTKHKDDYFYLHQTIVNNLIKFKLPKDRDFVLLRLGDSLYKRVAKSSGSSLDNKLIEKLKAMVMQEKLSLDVDRLITGLILINSPKFNRDLKQYNINYTTVDSDSLPLNFKLHPSASLIISDKGAITEIQVSDIMSVNTSTPSNNLNMSTIDVILNTEQNYTQSMVDKVSKKKIDKNIYSMLYTKILDSVYGNNDIKSEYKSLIYNILSSLPIDVVVHSCVVDGVLDPFKFKDGDYSTGKVENINPKLKAYIKEEMVKYDSEMDFDMENEKKGKTVNEVNSLNRSKLSTSVEHYLKNLFDDCYNRILPVAYIVIRLYYSVWMKNDIDVAKSILNRKTTENYLQEIAILLEEGILRSGDIIVSPVHNIDKKTLSSSYFFNGYLSMLSTIHGLLQLE